MFMRFVYSYVHRIGRTGRAGNTGLATSFYVPGMDNKSECGGIAPSLLAFLIESKQVRAVPAVQLYQNKLKPSPYILHGAYYLKDREGRE